jgi:ABC-type branched-subunit amino acid transport system ATPase component
LLHVDNISKHFGELTAVSDVSFQIQEKEIVSIIGPNGAGKSTLLNLITREIRPSSGRVTYKGKDVWSLKKHELASLGISRTFQNVRLFKSNRMTVLDNIMVGLHNQYRQGLLSTGFGLKRVRLNELMMREKAFAIMKRIGIDHLAHIPVLDLSFGNQRLVELARALAINPKLLILDEPAAGLNDMETERLTQLIQNINNEGVSILLVEHHMGLVMEISDKVIVLNYGKKLAEGTPEQIQNNPIVVEAYLGKENSYVGT